MEREDPAVAPPLDLEAHRLRYAVQDHDSLRDKVLESPLDVLRTCTGDLLGAEEDLVRRAGGPVRPERVHGAARQWLEHQLTHGHVAAVGHKRGHLPKAEAGRTRHV